MALTVCSLQAAEDQVQAFAGNPVLKNGIIDSPEIELSQPESVIELGTPEGSKNQDQVKIVSKTFTPPPGFSFREFYPSEIVTNPDPLLNPNPGKFVDIFRDGGTLITVAPDSSMAIKIEGVWFPATALQFPLQAEGNLVPTYNSPVTVGGSTSPTVYHWAAKVPAFTVNVIRVPQYLYANTAYDVPVKIQINGLGPNVYVDPEKLTIYFVADGQTFTFSAPPFAQNDGWSSQDNGIAAEYTCWLPKETFNQMKIDKPVTLTSYFQVEGNFSSDGSSASGQGGHAKSPIPPMEIRKNCSPDAFSDDRVEVANLGQKNHFTPQDMLQQNFPACDNPQLHCQLLGEGYVYYPSPPEEPLANLPSYGFPQYNQNAYGVSANHGNGNAFGSNLYLQGELANTFNPRHVSLSALSQVLGIYCGVSYPSRNVVVAQRPGQVLDQIEGSFNFNAYLGSTAQMSINGSTGVITQYNLEDLKNAYAIVTFVLVPEKWTPQGAVEMLEAVGNLAIKIRDSVGPRSGEASLRFFKYAVNADGTADIPIEMYPLGTAQNNEFHATGDTNQTLKSASTSEFTITFKVGHTFYYEVESNNGIKSSNFSLFSLRPCLLQLSLIMLRERGST